MESGRGGFESLLEYDSKAPKKYMPLSTTFKDHTVWASWIIANSGNCLIKYMFESLQWQIGGGKIRDDIDKLQVNVNSL
jgi:hypothetical protein